MGTTQVLGDAFGAASSSSSDERETRSLLAEYRPPTDSHIMVLPRPRLDRRSSMPDLRDFRCVSSAVVYETIATLGSLGDARGLLVVPPGPHGDGSGDGDADGDVAPASTQAKKAGERAPGSPQKWARKMNTFIEQETQAVLHSSPLLGALPPSLGRPGSQTGRRTQRKEWVSKHTSVKALQKRVLPTALADSASQTEGGGAARPASDVHRRRNSLGSEGAESVYYDSLEEDESRGAAHRSSNQAFYVPMRSEAAPDAGVPTLPARLSARLEERKAASRRRPAPGAPSNLTLEGKKVRVLLDEAKLAQLVAAEGGPSDQGNALQAGGVNGQSIATSDSDIMDSPEMASLRRNASHVSYSEPDTETSQTDILQLSPKVAGPAISQLPRGSALASDPTGIGALRAEAERETTSRHYSDTYTSFSGSTSPSLSTGRSDEVGRGRTSPYSAATRSLSGTATPANGAGETEREPFPGRAESPNSRFPSRPRARASGPDGGDSDPRESGEDSGVLPSPDAEPGREAPAANTERGEEPPLRDDDDDEDDDDLNEGEYDTDTFQSSSKALDRSSSGQADDLATARSDNFEGGGSKSEAEVASESSGLDSSNDVLSGSECTGGEVSENLVTENNGASDDELPETPEEDVKEESRSHEQYEIVGFTSSGKEVLLESGFIDCDDPSLSPDPISISCENMKLSEAPPTDVAEEEGGADAIAKGTSLQSSRGVGEESGSDEEGPQEGAPQEAENDAKNEDSSEAQAAESTRDRVDSPSDPGSKSSRSVECAKDAGNSSVDSSKEEENERNLKDTDEINPRAEQVKDNRLSEGGNTEREVSREEHTEDTSSGICDYTHPQGTAEWREAIEETGSTRLPYGGISQDREPKQGEEIDPITQRDEGFCPEVEPLENDQEAEELSDGTDSWDRVTVVRALSGSGPASRNLTPDMDAAFADALCQEELAEDEAGPPGPPGTPGAGPLQDRHTDLLEEIFRAITPGEGKHSPVDETSSGLSTIDEDEEPQEAAGAAGGLLQEATAGGDGVRGANDTEGEAGEPCVVVDHGGEEDAMVGEDGEDTGVVEDGEDEIVGNEGDAEVGEFGEDSGVMGQDTVVKVRDERIMGDGGKDARMIKDENSVMAESEDSAMVDADKVMVLRKDSVVAEGDEGTVVEGDEGSVMSEEDESLVSDEGNVRAEDESSVTTEEREDTGVVLATSEEAVVVGGVDGTYVERRKDSYVVGVEDDAKVDRCEDVSSGDDVENSMLVEGAERVEESEENVAQEVEDTIIAERREDSMIRGMTGYSIVEDCEVVPTGKGKDDDAGVVEEDEESVIEEVEDAEGVESDEDAFVVEGNKDAVVVSDGEDVVMVDDNDDGVVVEDDNAVVVEDDEIIVTVGDDETAIVVEEDEDGVVVEDDGDTVVVEDDEDTIVVEDDNAIVIEDDENIVTVGDDETAIVVEEDEDGVVVEDDGDTVVVEDDEDTIVVEEDEDGVVVEEDEDTIMVEDDENIVTIKDNEDVVVVEDDENAVTVVDDEDSVVGEDDENSVMAEVDENAVTVKDDEDGVVVEDDEDTVMVEVDENAVTIKDEEDGVVVEDDETTVLVEEDDAVVVDYENIVTVEDDENAFTVDDYEDAVVVDDDKDGVVSEGNKDTVMVEEKDAVGVEDDEDGIVEDDGDSVVVEEEEDGVVVEGEGDTVLAKEVRGEETAEVEEDENTAVKHSEDAIVGEGSLLKMANPGATERREEAAGHVSKSRETGSDWYLWEDFDRADVTPIRSGMSSGDVRRGMRTQAHHDPDRDVEEGHMPALQDWQKDNEQGDSGSHIPESEDTDTSLFSNATLDLTNPIEKTDYEELLNHVEEYIERRVFVGNGTASRPLESRFTTDDSLYIGGLEGVRKINPCQQQTEDERETKSRRGEGTLSSATRTTDQTTCTAQETVLSCDKVGMALHNERDVLEYSGGHHKAQADTRSSSGRARSKRSCSIEPQRIPDEDHQESTVPERNCSAPPASGQVQHSSRSDGYSGGKRPKASLAAASSTSSDNSPRNRSREDGDAAGAAISPSSDSGVVEMVSKLAQSPSEVSAEGVVAGDRVSPEAEPQKSTRSEESADSVPQCRRPLSKLAKDRANRITSGHRSSSVCGRGSQEASEATAVMGWRSLQDPAEDSEVEGPDPQRQQAPRLGDMQGRLPQANGTSVSPSRRQLVQEYVDNLQCHRESDGCSSRGTAGSPPGSPGSLPDNQSDYEASDSGEASYSERLLKALEARRSRRHRPRSSNIDIEDTPSRYRPSTLSALDAFLATLSRYRGGHQLEGGELCSDDTPPLLPPAAEDNVTVQVRAGPRQHDVRISSKRQVRLVVNVGNPTASSDSGFAPDTSQSERTGRRAGGSASARRRGRREAQTTTAQQPDTPSAEVDQLLTDVRDYLNKKLKRGANGETGGERESAKTIVVEGSNIEKCFTDRPVGGSRTRLYPKGRVKQEERRGRTPLDPALKERQRIQNSINAINGLLKQFS